MLKKTKSRTALLAALSALSISVCTGCGLIPGSEEEHKLNIVTEDVSSNYSLAMVELHDAIETITISCTYSQIREEKLSFQEFNRQVGNIYVTEGEDVTEGQLLAELDITDLQNGIEKSTNTIKEDELLIKQAEEMIDFYTKRIDSPATSLKNKEDYILSRQTYEENLVKYKNEIQNAEATIEKNNETIEKCRIYAPFTGTISSFREDLSTWHSTKGGYAMTIIDASVCAFKSLNLRGAECMHVGDNVNVVLSNGNTYSTTVISINSETCEIVMELDEPDYSLSVGTRGNARIVLNESLNTPSVPKTCVFSTEEYDYVFVLSDNGVREMRKIEAGVKGDDYVEIKSGVELYSSVIMK